MRNILAGTCGGIPYFHVGKGDVLDLSVWLSQLVDASCSRK